MAALHNVLTLDVAGAAVMALKMVADCDVVRYNFRIDECNWHIKEG